MILLQKLALKNQAQVIYFVQTTEVLENAFEILHVIYYLR